MKKILIIILVSLLIGCDKEYETRLADLKTPVCTGFYLTDQMGYDYKIIGHPNVKRNDSPDGNANNSNHHLAVFPNPAYSDRIYIAVISKLPSRNKTVWMVAATVDIEMEPMYQVMNSSYLIAGGNPVFSSENDSSFISRVDLSNIPEGYYRVYCQVDDVLLWDNIIFLKENYENTGNN